MDRTARQSSRLHKLVRHADSLDKVMDPRQHGGAWANLVSLVGRLHSSSKSMEQVKYSNSSVEYVKISGSSEFEEEEFVIQKLEIGKRDLQQIIEKEVRNNLILQASLEIRKQTLQKQRLQLGQNVSSLQEQLQVEMDLRVALKVQDEEW